MPKYIPYDLNQDAMVVINFADQLQANTFEHALAYLIDERINLSRFDASVRNDEGEGGRPAYDPAIMLKIILFAYSKGITSSREIEWSCRTNIIFKALSCDSMPHFTSIASFVRNHGDAIEDLFSQIVLVCEQEGLIGRDLFAIDGCKLSSNASKEWSGTFKELEAKREKIRRLIEYHKQDDAQNTDTTRREDRRIQRTQQKIDTLNRAFDKIDQFVKTQSPRKGQGKQGKEVKSNITDNESAKMKTSKGVIQGYNGIATVDQKHQVIVDAQAFGASQEQHTLKPIITNLKKRFNALGITDDTLKDGVVITADTGFANDGNYAFLKEEGINAYIPDNQFRQRDPKFFEQKGKYGKRHQDKIKGQRGVIPASEFTLDAEQKTCVCPQMNTMWLHNETTLASGNTKLSFEGKLTDCRQCPRKHECMRNPSSADTRTGHGRQVSFTINNGRSATDWMKRRVDSDEGRQIYGHRMSVVEPVFGNITVNKRLNRFSLRGNEKVNTQWKLYCLVHNIEKIMNYGKVA
ncbi:MAG: IS1182 family transposase [Gammaproteobacteria bacterium]|nr:IS1182 family transposase [Gammaproteobacteria bacterium]